MGVQVSPIRLQIVLQGSHCYWRASHRGRYPVGLFGER
jgi:hypothetical protein